MHMESANIQPPELCKCLGESTRFHVVALLSRHGELCVCDLVEALALPQSTVSRHLSQLRQCGILSARRAGQWMHYELNADLPEWAFAVIQQLTQPAVLPELPDACCSGPSSIKEAS